jgi:hypothetical protein
MIVEKAQCIWEYIEFEYAPTLRTSCTSTLRSYYVPTTLYVPDDPTKIYLDRTPIILRPIRVCICSADI